MIRFVSEDFRGEKLCGSNKLQKKYSWIHLNNEPNGFDAHTQNSLLIEMFVWHACNWFCPICLLHVLASFS